MDKRNTALVIPNAIEITAKVEGLDNEKEYFFTSFMNRDATFNLLEKMWQLRKELGAGTETDSSVHSLSF